MTYREFVGYRYSRLRNSAFVAKATTPVSKRCSRVGWATSLKSILLLDGVLTVEIALYDLAILLA